MAKFFRNLGAKRVKVAEGKPEFVSGLNAGGARIYEIEVPSTLDRTGFILALSQSEVQDFIAFVKKCEG